jgi:peptide-methionine (S)-S-oxide reductase
MGDHTETVDVDYDPNQTSYAELLDIFWNNHDSCMKNKRQYMSAIFYHDDEQKELVLKMFEEAKK